MHELYIADAILKSAREALPPEVDALDIKELRVEVGRLDAVAPESLIFMFDALKSSGEYGLPNARLEITPVEVLCRCRTCDAEFPVAAAFFRCPECDSALVDIIQGRGIMLREIITGNGAVQ